jgi:hypothetical protein
VFPGKEMVTKLMLQKPNILLHHRFSRFADFCRSSFLRTFWEQFLKNLCDTWSFKHQESFVTPRQKKEDICFWHFLKGLSHRTRNLVPAKIGIVHLMIYSVLGAVFLCIEFLESHSAGQSPGIDSKESIPPAYVAWRPSTMITLCVVAVRQATLTGGIDSEVVIGMFDQGVNNHGAE